MKQLGYCIKNRTESMTKEHYCRYLPDQQEQAQDQVWDQLLDRVHELVCLRVSTQIEEVLDERAR